MSNVSKYKFKILNEINDDVLTTIFDDEYSIYVKPGIYAMSSRKLEYLIYIARLQKY